MAPPTRSHTRGRSPILLEIYVDASYIEGGEVRSQIGYCLHLNQLSGMVYPRSVRNISVSMSSVEAELRALNEATMEAIWLPLFLEELGLSQTEPTVIWEDNSAVITLH